MAAPERGHFHGAESALLLSPTQLRSLPAVLHGLDREVGASQVRRQVDGNQERNWPTPSPIPELLRPHLTVLLCRTDPRVGVTPVEDGHSLRHGCFGDPVVMISCLGTYALPALLEISGLRGFCAI